MKILKKYLWGSCISEYVENQRIKEISKRAIWLGNDETHYTKIWRDKDIKDLKKLIDLVVHYIVSDIESEEILREMSKNNKMEVDKEKEKSS